MPSYNVLPAHAIVDPDSTAEDLMGIRAEMLKTARQKFGIRHATFQLEFTASDCHEENHHVDHLRALSRESPQRIVRAAIPVLDGTGPELVRPLLSNNRSYR